jgi:hypothetical protein
MGELKGGFNVCVPPHELVTVKVPVVGGFVKLTAPVKPNVLVADAH